MISRIALVFLAAAASLSAQVKVSDLPAASALAGSEKFNVVQSAASKAATIDQIKTYVSNSLGGTLAPINNPTFTGTVTIPGGAVISGYLTTANANSNFAPIANPTFTGAVTIPAGASISGYLTTAAASSTYLSTISASTTYAPIASPTFTGVVTIPSGASIAGYLTVANANSGFQPLDGDLTSIAAITTTTYGRSVLATADAAALRTLAGLGTLATQSATITDYLLAATASTTYAPIASPTFTGTVTIPAGASISGYLTSATASSTYLPSATAATTYAPIASPTFTGTVTIPTGAVMNTPGSINLSNASALPVGSVTGLGTNIAAFLVTPTKANLNAAVSDDDPAYVGTANTFTQAQTISGLLSANNIRPVTNQGGSIGANGTSFQDGWFAGQLQTQYVQFTVGSGQIWGRASNSIGLGAASATPTAQTLGGQEANGTDITGGTLNLGTRGTGSAAGGTINLQTHASGGASGTTLRTLVTQVAVTASAVTITPPTSINLSNQGTTPVSGLTVQSTTAATVGAQVESSPSFVLQGSGWKTTATAASQTVAFLQNVLPVAGTTAPTGIWQLQYAIAGGAATTLLTADSGIGEVALQGNTTNSRIYGYRLRANNRIELTTSFGAAYEMICGSDVSGLCLQKDWGMNWTNNVSVNAGARNLWLGRDSAYTAGVLQMGQNDPTTATPQVIKAHDVVTGAGASLRLRGGAGSTVRGIVRIDGTPTNDTPTAGDVGEYVEAKVAVGSPVALTTATPANVASISLTAGDWDVTGNVNFLATAATSSAASAGISTTSATLPTDGTEAYNGETITSATSTSSITLNRKRISISTTTTVYLVGSKTFTGTSVGGFGSISARRVR